MTVCALRRPGIEGHHNRKGLHLLFLYYYYFFKGNSTAYGPLMCRILWTACLPMQWAAGGAASVADTGFSETLTFTALGFPPNQAQSTLELTATT